MVGPVADRPDPGAGLRAWNFNSGHTPLGSFPRIGEADNALYHGRKILHYHSQIEAYWSSRKAAVILYQGASTSHKLHKLIERVQAIT
jgi:hypothetical protein